MQKRLAPILISASSAGHRASYVALFSKMFQASVRASPMSVVFSQAPLFFLMIEESFALFALTGLVRAALGKRTVGILMRPGPALQAAGLRTALKKALLVILRRTPGVTTLTIVPHYLETGFASIADGWIYDPQMWDLDAKEPASLHTQHQEQTGAVPDVQEVAAGRRIVSAIGRQDKAKGFEQFAALFAHEPELRRIALFAYAGKISSDLANEDAAFRDAGGFGMDRFVTDEEILQLYAMSDFVWCAYSPLYDQASGIFGRALQFGLVPIVREHSLIHRQCIADQLVHIAISQDTSVAGLCEALKARTNRTAYPIAKWRAHSIGTMNAALGIG